MQQIEQLIQKFWSGQASEEETRLLAKLLEEQEAEWTDSLKTAFFRLSEEETAMVEPARASRILDNLHARIEHTEIATPAKLVSLQQKRVWWAAAAVIILLGASIFMVMQQTTGKKQVAGISNTKTNRHLETVANTTDTPQVVRLQDGSVVTLGSRSALSWYQPFADSSRDISLTGQAKFSVAKDARKPFTVYANGIATTALGTVFTVNTLLPPTVNVILFEGRVVIRGTDSKGFAMKEVFLSPGQQFTIDRTTNKYLVSNQAAPENTLAATPVKKTEKPQQALANTVRLSFDHEPLYSVFDQLNKTYQTNIRFNRKDISGLYFSGTVLKGDSLRTVLTAICNMNQLLFTEQQGYIQVKKSN